MEIMVARVLVTGANGFIGSQLCPLLESRGIEVVRATRLNAGDLTDSCDWRPLLEGVDGVVHLAARVHVLRENLSLPLERFRQVNVHATAHLARQAAQMGVKRFVFASTIGVLGVNTNGIPFTESHPAAPVNDYARSKWEAEQALTQISQETGLEVVTIRPPLVYGAGVKANFYMLMRAVEERLPLPLASIRNKRDMIYVGNLVDAMHRCLIHPNAAGQTFVIADGRTVSTPDLMRMIAHYMNKKIHLLPCPSALLNLGGTLLGKSAMVHRLTGSLEVSATHLRHSLDWHPPYSIEAGLEHTVQWFMQERARLTHTSRS